MNNVNPEQHSGFETVFRDSMDGLAIFKEGIFVDCNQSMLNIVGATDHKQFVGQTPGEFSPQFQPDGQPSAEKAAIMINHCIEQGSVRFEWVHKKLDGEEFWAEVLLTRMFLDGEEVIHTSWRDISEKKLLELETHKQKQTFETLFNDSLDGLCILSKEGFIDCNNAYVELFGFSEKHEVIGITPLDISPEYQPDGRASAPQVVATLEAAFTEGKVRFEWVHKKCDGTEFWCEIVLFKITVEDNEVLYASTRDISHKKALELETVKQKQTFETLFNDSLDGLCLLTKEAYIDCNPAFVELFGFKNKSEVIGISPIDISPEFQPDGQTSVNKAVAIIKTAFSEGKIRFEWMHKKTDGTEFWCEIVLFKIIVEDNEVLYASTRDISEKKALELALHDSFEEVKKSNRELEDMVENLHRTQEKLVESEKMASLGSLVAGVAHEVNTPVGIALTGTTQLMEESRDIAKRYEEGVMTEDDFEDYLSMTNELSELVKKNLQRTAQLVRSFKQVAVDQTSEEDRDVNLKVYFEEVLSSLASVIRKGQANVELDCPDGIDIVTTPGLLAQVLTNLIVNSITHGFNEQEGGNILLLVREQDEGEIQILYKDDGKGISQQNLAKIFEPFFTTNRGKGGTGLGLNITYNIVTSALGGSIKCTSAEGEGVEFDIRFKAKKHVDL